MVKKINNMKNLFFAFLWCLILYSPGNASLYNQKYGDANNNKQVNIIDARIVVQHYLGLINSLPRPIPFPANIDSLELFQTWAKVQEIDLTGYQMKVIESTAAG